MPKTSNQKERILYILEFLLERTDEDHRVTINQICEYVSSMGAPGERKAIYDDIEALKRHGYDIICSRGNNGGYFIGERDFELAELKLLVDSIQSYKFITEKKTNKLIEKLEKLCSEHDAKKLQRQVFVQGRVKSMNESVYYYIDEISKAINDQKKITFQYVRYNSKKEKEYRHDGKVYCVSPYALIMDNENYYCVAWDNESKLLKHFRVDLMEKINESDEDRDGKEELYNFSVEKYAKEIFNMYGGEKQMVQIKVSNQLIGVVLDQFGRDVWMHEEDDEYCTIRVNVVTSPQFYAWIFPFGKNMEVLSPQSVRDEIKKMAQQVAEIY